MTVKELISKNDTNGRFQVETFDKSCYGYRKILAKTAKEAIDKYGNKEVKEWYAESDYYDDRVTISIEI